MKYFIKYTILILIFMFVCPIIVNAQRGCCFHHGGVAGCSQNGRQICRDGTLSPSCTCTPKVTYIYGCTDSSAKNYNSKANKDNGTCQYYIYGCTDPEAKNYNANADKDDNTCEYYVYGCTDIEAKNYNRDAEKDDGSCEYYIYGCTDSEAKNYNENADKDDNTCEYYVQGCTDSKAINYNKKAEKDDGSCKYNDKKEEKSTDDSGSLLPVMTIGGIGVTIYYFKKKKV